jgi:hypothetical protein
MHTAKREHHDHSCAFVDSQDAMKKKQAIRNMLVAWALVVGALAVTGVSLLYIQVILNWQK